MNGSFFLFVGASSELFGGHGNIIYSAVVELFDVWLSDFEETF